MGNRLLPIILGISVLVIASASFGDAFAQTCQEQCDADEDAAINICSATESSAIDTCQSDRQNQEAACTTQFNLENTTCDNLKAIADQNCFALFPPGFDRDFCLIDSSLSQQQCQSNAFTNFDLCNFNAEFFFDSCTSVAGTDFKICAANATSEGDQCRASCPPPPAVCGNSIVEDPEDCDDGNLDNFDGCTNICEFLSCGPNSILDGAQCIPDPGSLVTCGPDTELQGNECVSTVMCPVPDPTTAELTVIKDVVNDDGGTAMPGDFTMNISPASNPSQNNFEGSLVGTLVTIDPGAYSVGESGPGGYTSSLSPECSGVAVAGESYTCTIINNDNPPKPDPQSTLEHFLAYNIKDTDKKKFKNTYAGLADQFGEGQFKVYKPYRLLNPVDKNNEGMTDYETHLMAYKIKQQKGYQDSGADDTIHVEDQFGTLTLDVKKPRLLLVPTAKNHDVQPQMLPFDSADHFKCYDVRETKNTPKFQDKIVSVYDPNFQETIQHEVDKPRWFCNPVQKTHGNYIGNIINSEDNLLCYDVDNVKGEEKHKRTNVFTNNQFGPEGLQTKKIEELCVPSAIVTPNGILK